MRAAMASGWCQKTTLQLRMAPSKIKQPFGRKVLNGRNWPDSDPTGVAPGQGTSEFRSLRHLQRVVTLDAKVANGALEVDVSEEQSYGPQISGPPVD
jgi:hypothetical protein